VHGGEAVIAKAFVLAAALAFAACSHTYPPPRPVPLEGDECERAASRLEQLDCRREDGSPLWRTPGGAAFVDFCHAAMNDGRDVRPDCLALVSSCDDVATAYRTPREGACPKP
jgi:hypothetical protein